MADLKYYQAVKGVILYSNKILLLKAEPYEGGEYEVPGGRKESSDEDDEIALKREISEEVGLVIRVNRLLNVWSLKLPKFGLSLDGKTYLCESLSNNVKLSKEHVKYKWVSTDEALKLSIPGWLREAIGRINIKNEKSETC